MALLESHLASSRLIGLNVTEANLRMKPADVAWPLRERNSLEISTRVEGTKHVQVGTVSRLLLPCGQSRGRRSCSDGTQDQGEAGAPASG